MDIEMLREFIVFSRHMNMTTAAAELNLAVSTLSRHITSMEKELGTALLRRDGKPKLTLTSSGCQVLEEACEIVSRYETLLSRIATTKTRTSKRVRISYALDDRVMVDAISMTNSSFKSVNSEISIDTITIRDRDLFEALNHGDTDIIIAYDFIDSLNLDIVEAVPLLTDTLLVALPNNQAPINRMVSPEDLADKTIPWASASRDDYLSRVLRLFEHCNQQPHIRWINADDMDDFYQHLLKRREMWFFSKRMYEDYAFCIPAAYRESVTACELKDVDTSLTRHAVYKKTDRMSAFVVKKLCEYGFGIDTGND